MSPSELARDPIEEPDVQYIHESFQLVPGAIPEFTESFQERYLPLMSEGGARLVGLWEPVAISLPWSRAVTLWEIDGPAVYQQLVRTLHTKEEARLRDWQASLRGISSGGEGRLLEAPPEAPTLADLRARGVSLDVIVHETITTQPDRQVDYVTDVVQKWLPASEKLGRIWIGTYFTVWRNRQAFSLWALQDPGLPLPGGSVEEREVLEGPITREWMAGALRVREAYDDGIMYALPPTRSG
ncbi:MAG: hypothetical protein JRG86_06465 [Deltaproteobacteria bacterium]|nr:hypothetical protein [Deltaproteobacteria bacterium]MBW2497015.1 hypothetical protein [Deltaproteobacteria bacterium]